MSFLDFIFDIGESLRKQQEQIDWAHLDEPEYQVREHSGHYVGGKTTNIREAQKTFHEAKRAGKSVFVERGRKK